MLLLYQNACSQPENGLLFRCNKNYTILILDDINANDYHQQMRRGNVFSRICLCVCRSVSNPLMKALIQKVHVWYAGTSSESAGQVRVSGSLT